MANRYIEQLPPVKHQDVKPLYSKEEVLDKLASSVKYLRDNQASGSQQQIELEIMYSIAKALWTTAP